MMNGLFFVILTVFLIVFQTVIFPSFIWFSQCFDLMIMNIIFLSLVYSHYAVILTIILIGGIMDSIWSGFFSSYFFLSLDLSHCSIVQTICISAKCAVYPYYLGGFRHDSAGTDSLFRVHTTWKRCHLADGFFRDGLADFLGSPPYSSWGLDDKPPAAVLVVSGKDAEKTVCPKA